MGLLRLLVSGAALAAGAYYVTRKRSDGSSVIDDLKVKAPKWMNKAQSYIEQAKERVSKAVQGKADLAKSDSYPEKFNDFSPDPDPKYSS